MQSLQDHSFLDRQPVMSYTHTGASNQTALDEAKSLVADSSFAT